jgi:hypothetical protein
MSTAVSFDAVRPASRASMGPFQAIAAAWLLSLGVDLFLHGGLLARVYVQPSPFLLDAETAFRRIPFGYATFLLLTAGLYWLLNALRVRGAAAGLRYGFGAGALVWGAHVIGLYSISTAPPSLLTGWWLGQTAELSLAGALLGAAAAGMTPRRMWTIVAITIVACLFAMVAMQSLGLAPAMKLVPAP